MSVLRKPTAPVFAIEKSVVESIRDPLALALYVYICSDLRRHPLRQFESVLEHFGWTVEETDRAYAELKRLGVVS